MRFRDDPSLRRYHYRARTRASTNAACSPVCSTLETFRAHGLPTDFVQASTSYNSRRGTLRGLHYQAEPHAETKLVRCTAGAIFDVIVDVRPGSPSFGRWQSFELTGENRLDARRAGGLRPRL